MTTIVLNGTSSSGKTSRARGDRNLGQARGIGATVHSFLAYDLELDSSRHSPEQLAEQVVAAVRGRQEVVPPDGV